MDFFKIGSFLPSFLQNEQEPEPEQQQQQQQPADRDDVPRDGGGARVAVPAQTSSLTTPTEHQSLVQQYLQQQQQQQLFQQRKTPLRLSTVLSQHFQTKSSGTNQRRSARTSTFVVDQSSSEGKTRMNINALLPATQQAPHGSSSQAFSSFARNFRSSKSEDSFSKLSSMPFKSDPDDSKSDIGFSKGSESFSVSHSSNRYRRLQRCLSARRKEPSAPTKTVKMRSEDGTLTKEFKEVLVRLAKKRLQDELADIKKAKMSVDDTCLILMQGALEYLNQKLRDGDLEVDGANSMIPEEYCLNHEKADHDRTEADILQFEIERMRGSSMRVGTAQTARNQPKKAAVTSDQENLLRKLVEIGFLLNDRAVTLTIERFVENENSVQQFKRLGLRQRSKESARVLLNKLFTQNYKQAMAAFEEATKESLTEDEEEEESRSQESTGSISDIEMTN